MHFTACCLKTKVQFESLKQSRHVSHRYAPRSGLGIYAGYGFLEEVMLVLRIKKQVLLICRHFRL